MKLDITPEKALEILFLASDPFHVKTNPKTSEKCHSNDLIDLFKLTYKNNEINKLLPFLERNVSRLTTIIISNKTASSFRHGFKTDERLEQQDRELLSMVDILTSMGIPVPVELESNKVKIQFKYKIPDDWPADVNVHATNRMYVKIADSLSCEQVQRILQLVPRMIPELEEFGSLEEYPDLGGDNTLKNLAFFTLILLMQYHCVLTRVHTHRLVELLEKIISKDPNMHMQKTIQTLKQYPLTPKKPGMCIVFSMKDGRPDPKNDGNEDPNNETFFGVEQDMTRAAGVFEDVLKYDVLTYTDPTKYQVRQCISELSHPRYAVYDSLVVIFMAHGQKSHLLLADGAIHRRLDIVKPFSEIEWLKNKPKLFFIQACADREGFKAQSGGLAHDAWKIGGHEESQVVNPLADTLVSNATMWYEKAYRTCEGSLYIRHLMNCLEKNGRKDRIEKILADVNYMVNRIPIPEKFEVLKQSPYYECALQKEFIFPSED